MPRVKQTARTHAPPGCDLDPALTVVGVDPGNTTALAVVRDGVMVSHAQVDTGGCVFEGICALCDALDGLRPEALVVERQFVQARMVSIEAAVIAYGRARKIRVVRHSPRDLHAITRPVGVGHVANKRASVALARRLWGGANSETEKQIAGSRKHDVMEAFLMGMLHTGKLAGVKEE